MTIDEFWTIVERVHAASPNDMKEKCRLLGEELRRLPAEEVLSFGGHFTHRYYSAYKHEIWEAAYIINCGCSDDSFMDFRSTLISLGRAAYEAAMRDADSLADFDIDPAWATYEGYQSISTLVYEDLMKQMGVLDQELFELEEKAWATAPRHPKKPEGVSTNAWEWSKQFPRLAAKYGHNDSDHLGEKEFGERLAKKEQLATVVRTILLESGIIPSCGLIPPPRVVGQVLQTGRSPESTKRQYTWETFDFDEGHFWAALSQLQKATPEELKSRPDLAGVKLTLDVGAPGVENFEDWMRTLRERGLA